MINPKLQGWFNYYGRFNPSILRMHRDRQRRRLGGHHRGAMGQNLGKQSLAF
jgi:hypothetical protein